MSKYDTECQYTIFDPSFNVKIGFLNDKKYDIWPQLECQNRILNVQMIYSASFPMSK